jgi:hypothetical protein
MIIVATWISERLAASGSTEVSGLPAFVHLARFGSSSNGEYGGLRL